ncbi:hypothetical protein ABZ446_40905 [Streptomyces sp. NPDC005813]|uniref:hypothetical protein n=1 Tax=Streptomyces sp. NPDC005813 TaxID=3155592 RepID=UPI003409C892
MIVDGGTHMDFYDVPKYVDRAVEEAVPFFEEHLAAGGTGPTRTEQARRRRSRAPDTSPRGPRRPQR